MKKTNFFIRNTLFLGIAGMLTMPSPVHASSYYKVDKFGELYNYEGSSNVTIKANTSAISEDAFNDDKITSFTVAAGNPYFKTINGILYTKDGKTLVKCPTEKSGSITIPSTVKRIAANAFLDCDITKVTIPSSVTSIGKNAFSGCEYLTSVSLQANIKNIPSCCFEDCDLLKKINIPTSVTTIDSYAFSGCDSLKNITLPKNLKQISSRAFQYCSGLTSITIPSKVTYIDAGVFYHCSSLETVTLTNKVKEIYGDAFNTCEKLTTVKNTNGLEYIGTSAFNNCTKLAHFSFSNRLETIKNSAFQYCKSLGTIHIPSSVRTIESCAFRGAASQISVSSSNKYYASKNGMLLNKEETKLIQIPYGKKGDVTVPETVTKTTDYAFNNLSLTTLTLSDNITELSNSYFDTCPNLTSIHLPANLTKLNCKYYEPQRSNCPKLKEITISQDNPYFSSYDGVIYNKEQSLLCFYPAGKRGKLTLPVNCANITSQLNNNKLSTISVPKKNVNYSCSDGVLLNYKGTKIICYPSKKETFKIPRYVTDISYLDNVKTYISLKSLTCAAKNKTFYSIDGVLFTKRGKELTYYPPCKKGTYKTPKTTQYIANSAFEYATKLTKLTLTKNIKRHSYNTYSFEGCENLKEFIVNEGNLNTIKLSFDEIASLRKIVLPSNIMTVKMYDLPDGVNIYGWTNTGAQTIARDNECNFICRGTVPEKVSGIRMKKIIDKYELTWNASSGVSGYQIYTQYETLAEISGSNKTSYIIKSLDDIDGSKIYVRAYKTQNGKKVYGKGKGISTY